LKLINLIAKIVREKISKNISMKMMVNLKIYSKMMKIMKVIKVLSINKIWDNKWYFNKILNLMLILMINKKKWMMMKKKKK
jgi:hypothetical protein